MKFTLEINLDNAEVDLDGIDSALPEYLIQVAKRTRTGYADAGIVQDINGNTIGKYMTTDD